MGKLGDFTLDQVSGATALLLGSIGGLLLIIFKSRCETISCCWGLWQCKRQLIEEDEDEDKDKDKKKIKPVIKP